jgi:hypothetical protein
MPADLPDDPLRPRDLARLLLASRDVLPRKRARDQQADLAGLALKRSVLERLAELDPEPAEVEETLLNIVAGLGEPSGPARAVAVLVRDEWRTACACPEWVAHLLAEALAGQGGESEGAARG